MAMADKSSRIADLRRRILTASPQPTWKTPDDLARMSAEALTSRSEGVREGLSTGSIHLAGGGVTGSSASFSDVGDVMKNFQKLVTALGASRRGYTNLKGKIAADVSSLTNLRLIASPFVGSVVLDFMPDIHPSEELAPSGQPAIFDQPAEQLSDSAVTEALDILESIKEVGPDADGSEFLASVSRRGPRAATAVRDFARTLASGDFETDLSWRIPGRPTIRTTLTSAEADHISRLIVSRELDKDEVVIEGVLRTVSDLSALYIQTEEGLESIDGIDLPSEVIAAAHVQARVRVRAEMTIQQRPGGVDVAKYRAIGMEFLPASGD
jgi:hypothetical protein